eukprot:scaffold8479_cov112-Isochrysis_galbana.AAC.2
MASMADVRHGRRCWTAGPVGMAWLALAAVSAARASVLGGGGGPGGLVGSGRGGGDSAVGPDDLPGSGLPGVVTRLARRSDELATGGGQNREYRESELIGRIVELNQQLQRERQVPRPRRQPCWLLPPRSAPRASHGVLRHPRRRRRRPNPFPQPIPTHVPGPPNSPPFPPSAAAGGVPGPPISGAARSPRGGRGEPASGQNQPRPNHARAQVLHLAGRDGVRPAGRAGHAHGVGGLGGD